MDPQLKFRIKIFSDGADLASMVEMNNSPLIKGMTTNPSLMKKAGVKDYKNFCKEVLSQIKVKPISFEVFADDFLEMRRQALEIATWGNNVYVKIPVINSVGRPSFELIRELSEKKVKLNITAVFTLKQVIDTCQALKGGAPSIVSVFAGRIADTGKDPMPLMQAAGEICRSTDAKIELLWASTREILNIVQAEQCGCDIITAPFDILKKLSATYGKGLDEMSVDTVKTFKKDAEGAGYSL
jgi:transaldolase